AGTQYGRGLFQAARPPDVEQTASARHAFVSAANEIGTTQSVRTARLRCGIVPFTRLPSHGEGPMLGIIARREFIALLGGAAAWPLTARAQQAAKPPTIGFLGSGTLTAHGHWVDAFLQRLRVLGWIEGRNLVIEYRWGEGSRDRAAVFAAEFVRLKVDIIVTYAVPMVLAAKQATSTIPIVFAAAADPVGTGLGASLARPGGNVTGLSAQHTELAGKRLALLREIVPSVRRLAVMANVDNPASERELGEVQAVAGTLGLEVARLEIRREEDIARAFEEL